MATIGEMFYIVNAGQGRWIVHHQVTGYKAGSLVRTSDGLMLVDTESRPIGKYETVDEALRELYATA
jgi:hypothetical protein